MLTLAEKIMNVVILFVAAVGFGTIVWIIGTGIWAVSRKASRYNPWRRG